MEVEISAHDEILEGTELRHSKYIRLLLLHFRMKQEKDVNDVIKRNSDLVQELESTYWNLVSNEKIDVSPFKVTQTGQ